MSERVQPTQGSVKDDNQKGRWGGRAEVGGRRLRAVYLGGGRDEFQFNLVVESIDGSELKGPFYFHLHESFKLSTYHITNVRLGYYAMFEQITAYETFTAAVEVLDRKGKWVALELDLESVSSIPAKYKPRQLDLQRAGIHEETVSGRKKVLERIVRANAIITNPMDWRSEWAKAERWVCRICLGRSPLGTGVLVGNNVVITNWHVVEQVKAEPGSSLRFEFDHLYGVGGQRPEPFVRKGATEWLLSKGEYTLHEGKGLISELLPEENELDFALIRLELGDDPLGGRRGFATVPDGLLYRSGDGLIILQHPEGNPQCFAVDFQGIIGLNANGTRLWYATNTQPGASGAPCFDLDWQFVALHHAGYGDWPAKNAYNQGIPSLKLRTAIQKAVAVAG